MAATLLNCTRCRTPLPVAFFNRLERVPCPGCGAGLRIHVFPALFRPHEGTAGAGEPLAGNESACFYHPEKRAVVPCESCGRFLCSLCDVVVGGGHYCPACLETGRNKGRMGGLVSSRQLYDNLALALVLVPLVVFPLFWMTAVTAPMAGYYLVRHWKSPSSLLPRTRVRFVAALVLALVEMLFWVFLLVAFLLQTQDAVVLTE